MKSCGWWFQIKFALTMYMSRIAELFGAKRSEEDINAANAAYNSEQYKGD